VPGQRYSRSDSMPGAQGLRRDAAANRERRIEVAIDVFNVEGSDACVEQIAQRAGVGIGTLYRRFPTKEALIAHLVDELLIEMIEAGDRARDLETGHGLEQYMRAVGDMFARRKGFLSPLWGGGEVTRIEQLRAGQHALLIDPQYAGVIGTDIIATDLTLLLWSLRGIARSSGDFASQACQRHLDMVFAGLHSRPGTLTNPPPTARQLNS